MTDDECIHGMTAAWCGLCIKVEPVPTVRSGSYGFHGGETKQDVIDEIHDLLGMRRQAVSNGSSLPASMFRIACERLGLPYRNMPDACERIVKRAGLRWNPDFDSRATRSGGGSTVTLEGAQAMRDALRALLS
ncbi:hypothetical protein FE374_00930 [Georgenia yuyongxinii]|uniref:Uncharacterized protein n=1 Tax=Georgenia yuyongxinii TaxID=2589797 RepID=A0A5B8BYQ0_9MICO|nr:hypothetical protein [Georgenia yuyongxinii]QDC23383.1 hypothetical protein FE374_00930 [Georgenia yuyongxinii]